MPRYLFILLLTLFPYTLSAAETPMRAGLWEVITTSHILNYASELTPEQADNLKKLANEYGFEMPEIQNGAAKSSACITPEMATQKVVPNAFQSQMGCTVKNISHTGNAYRMDFTCDHPQLQGSGVADGVFTNPENFVGKTTFKGLAQGIQVNEVADINGKWVSASCENSTP